MTEELTAEVELEAEPEADATQEVAEASEAAEDEGFIATLDGDPEPEAEPEETPVLREVRKRLREEQKARRDLERQVRESQAPVKPDEPLPPEPTLESAGYDESKFKADLLAWNERKQKADNEAEARRKEAEREAAAWAEKTRAYEAEKARIRADDVEEVEAFVRKTLSVTQQGIIIAGVKNSAALIYAIGRKPERVKELGAIKDPIEFAFAVARLETQMKIAPQKPPAPEKRVTPAGRGAPVADLEKLRKAAESTGDYSAYFAAKRRA